MQRNKEQELRARAARDPRARSTPTSARPTTARSRSKADESRLSADRSPCWSKAWRTSASPKARKLYFLRRVPADPMSGEEWGLRSYASPPTRRSAGKDVYDVYSRSDDKGLNGIAYREW